LNLQLVAPNEIENIICDPVKPEEVEKILNLYVPQMEGIISAASGIGLAAPQVGIKKKFFVIKNPNTGKYETYFNAFFVKRNDTHIKTREGCLSYGLQNTVEVKRLKSINLIYDEWDKSTKKFINKKEKVEHDLAIIFQHEIHHHGNGIGVKSKTIFNK